jgi:phospholipid/cholesterol/gamma-HCH transport system substrate-binding protein
VSEKNKEEITITLRNLSELTQNLNKIVFRLEKGRGTLGKLLVEEEIYDNFRDASVSAKLLFEELKKDPSRLLFKQK